MHGFYLLSILSVLITAFYSQCNAYILPDKTKSFYGPSDLEQPTYLPIRDGHLNSRSKAEKDLFYINQKPDIELNDLSLIHLGHGLDMDDEQAIPYASKSGYQFAVSDNKLTAEKQIASTLKPISASTNSNLKTTVLPTKNSITVLPTNTLHSVAGKSQNLQTTSVPLSKNNLSTVKSTKPVTKSNKKEQQTTKKLNNKTTVKGKNILLPAHGMSHAMAAPRMIIAQPQIALQPRMIIPQQQVAMQPRMIMPQQQVAAQPRMVMPQQQIAMQPRMIMPQQQVAMQPRMVMPQQQVAAQPQIAVQPRTVIQRTGYSG